MKKSKLTLIIEMAQRVLKECEYDAERIAQHGVVKCHYANQTPRFKKDFQRAVESSFRFNKKDSAATMEMLESI